MLRKTGPVILQAKPLFIREWAGFSDSFLGLERAGVLKKTFGIGRGPGRVLRAWPWRSYKAYYTARLGRLNLAVPFTFMQ